MSPQSLEVAIIGAGLGGLSAAIALRQQGHRVSIYDRSDFAGEIGAGLGVVPNAIKILEGLWNVDVSKARPVTIQSTLQRKWETSEVVLEAPTDDYKARFGYGYYGAVRGDLHEVLLEKALAQGCALHLKHKLVGVDHTTGRCWFENGVEVHADMVVGADGNKSVARSCIGIDPEIRFSSSCCYRLVISGANLAASGYESILTDGRSLNIWVKSGTEKLIIGFGNDGQTLCLYAFFPPDTKQDPHDFSWQTPATAEQIKESLPEVDPRIRNLFELGEDINVWRYAIHPEYPYWWKGRVCLVGDAAHPMMPEQNQGFAQVVEDAAALGLVFSPEYSDVVQGDVAKGFSLYQSVRKERATIVQAASLRAHTDIRERFGFKRPDDPPGKLTVEWLCDYDVVEHVREVIAKAVR